MATCIHQFAAVLGLQASGKCTQKIFFFWNCSPNGEAERNVRLFCVGSWENPNAIWLTKKTVHPTDGLIQDGVTHLLLANTEVPSINVYPNFEPHTQMLTTHCQV